MSRIQITKSGGQSESFSQGKLMRSLRQAGASQDLADEVWSMLEPELHGGMNSRQLQQRAFTLLRQLRRSVAARYRLKQAIMELGPSGYPFERLMGELFRDRGYKVEVGQVLPGHCVNHEVDVVGQLDEELLVVECKYRNTAGFKCDVKVPLYIHSRFEDLRLQRGLSEENFSGWIATNARFTGDAIKFADCVGLQLIGWDYPADDSLRHWLDNSRLYPLTVLTSLNKLQKQALLARNLILCKDILAQPDALHQLPGGLSPAEVRQILEECEQIAEGGD